MTHRFFPAATVILIALAICGSCSTGELKQEEASDGSLSLAPLVTLVCDRHDEGVTKDSTLNDTDRAAALADSILVRAAFKDKNVKVAPIYDPLDRVLKRHDAYVDASPASPASKRMAKYSSANIRRTIDEALGKNEEKPASAPAAPKPAG